MDNRRHCPWCAKAPITFEDEKGYAVMCINPACDMQPCSKNHKTKEEALTAWNVPKTGKMRYYSETELRDKLENIFADQFIMDFFFGEQKDDIL